jgi:hypothetical protein
VIARKHPPRLNLGHIGALGKAPEHFARLLAGGLRGSANVSRRNPSPGRARSASARAERRAISAGRRLAFIVCLAPISAKRAPRRRQPRANAPALLGDTPGLPDGEGGSWPPGAVQSTTTPSDMMAAVVSTNTHDASDGPSSSRLPWLTAGTSSLDLRNLAELEISRRSGSSGRSERCCR